MGSQITGVRRRREEMMSDGDEETTWRLSTYSKGGNQ